jgi:hypothetical protein
MPDQRRGRRSLARLLAPLALVGFAVVLAAIVFSSPAVDGDEGGGGRASERTTTAPEGQSDRRQRPRRRFYRVRAGDTLGAIAEQTGVPVERLLALNPELDPQALVAGQRIRLRE